MKVVIAIDSFKGSLTSMEAGYAAREGILKSCRKQNKADGAETVPYDIIIKPLADGGEGTTEALVEGLGGHFVELTVTGPLGEPVTAKYGILEAAKKDDGQKTNQQKADEQEADEQTADKQRKNQQRNNQQRDNQQKDNRQKEDEKSGKIAVLEMAQAAGITLVERDTLNPWKAATTGVGEMILDAIGRGCREFIMGIGGSATTEGGIGMLWALGYRFYDENGRSLPPVLESLGRLAEIRAEHIPPELSECRFQIACDVTNPLCGEQGAVYVYGPQKGVRLEEREQMDKMLQKFAEKTAEFTGQDNSRIPGAGAAGGLGFAALSFLPNAELKSGISLVLEAVGIEQELADADIVITGEGRLDAQTAMGKVPVGVARLAKQYDCMVLAFAGGVTEDAGRCNEEGIDAFFPIVRGVTTLEEAMEPEQAKRNLSLAVEQVFRLLQKKIVL